MAQHHEIPATPQGTPEKALQDNRQDRYRQAATLLRQWREDDNGYDEQIWPFIAEEFNLTEDPKSSS